MIISRSIHVAACGIISFFHQPTFLELWQSLWDPRPMPPLHSLSHTRQAWPHPASLCKTLQHPRWKLELQMFYQPTCHFMARDDLGWLTGERPSQGHSHSARSRCCHSWGRCVWAGRLHSLLCDTHRGSHHVPCMWQGSCALRQQQRASSSWAPA